MMYTSWSDSTSSCIYRQF